jgi:4'-phosphopantetheinyl transferase
MNNAWLPGPQLPVASSAEVHLWRIELDHGSLPFSDRLAPGERDRAARMRPCAFRRRWVASRWALRCVLARYLGEEPEAVELRLLERGKPALAEPSASLCFNLSHSGRLAVVAVVKDREIGVDIEQIDSSRDVLALAERGLDRTAAARVRATPSYARTAAFHAAWTHQEAHAKCLGSGLGMPLPRALVAVDAFDVGSDYAAAIAISGTQTHSLRCFTFTPNSLL